MTTVPLSDRLRTALIELMDVEMMIQTTLANSTKQVEPHPQARACMAEIEALAGDHIDAILARINSASDDAFTAPAHPSLARSGGTWLSDFHPISSSLRQTYALLNEAIIGYSMIQPIATRFRDSPMAADTGTTAHITRQHTQDYLAAAGRILDVIHEAVIWELNQGGLECSCSCPSCGLGVCLCSVSSRGILNSAWASSAPNPADGIMVQRPRTESPAAISGLREGEVVKAVDGQSIHTTADLQSAISEHSVGEKFTLQLERDGEMVDIAITRT